MKTLLICTAAAAVILSAPAAFAAQDHQDKHADHAATHATTPHTQAPRAQVIPKVHAMGTGHATVHADRTVASPSVSHMDTSTGHRGSTRVITTASPAAVAHDSQTRDNAASVRADQTQQNLSQSRAGARLSANFNRRNFSAQHHYHYRGGAYRGPSDYSYRRWTFGENLPAMYFVSEYLISDYSDYGLQYPPEGCEWVRYGDDALLIDDETGEILEVVYGQFY